MPVDSPLCSAFLPPGGQAYVVAGLELGSVRKPRTLVAGSALAVSHGEDLDFALAHAVYEAEGEARKDVPPNSIAVTWPSGRSGGKCSDRMSKLLSKTVRRLSTT